MGTVLTFTNEPLLYLAIGASWSLLLAAAFRSFYVARSFFPARPADRLLFVLSLAAALVEFFTTAHQAGDLRISDSVEYAVGAERIFTFGTYDLSIEGRSLPPRYQPFFSLLFGVPAYAIFHSGLGSPVYLIFGFAMLGFLAAWLAAYRIGGAWGAVTATVFLLVLPDLRALTEVVMADAPLVTTALLLMLLFLGIDRSRSQLWNFLAAGVLVALAVLLRSVSVFLALPFLLLLPGAGTAEGFRRLAALAAPIGCAFGAIFYCNTLVFQDPFRTGYHFWLPVPTDFPELLFSWSYVPKNGAALAESSGGLLLLLIIALSPLLRRIAARRSSVSTPLSTEESRSIIFSLLVTAGACAVFLPYFWSDFRFFAPATAALAVPAASALGNVWDAFRAPAWLRYALIVLLLGHGTYQQLSPLPLRRWEAATRIATHAPRDAVVITGLDPVYLEPLALRGTQRTAMPFSRAVEFASKICRVTPSPAGIHPRSATDHRAAGLDGAGSIDPVAHTAAEEPEFVTKILGSGRTVVFDGSLLSAAAERDFLSRFGFEPIAGRLYRLTLRTH